MIKLSKTKIFAVILFTTSYLVFNFNEVSFNKYVKTIVPRKLSLDLGGGKCKWTPPIYNVPDNIEFTKTIIAGFPSGDKRLTFVQMEALTGLSARDEWDFEYLGMTNQPFIKANYPHHEGIWGWQDAGDQVIMIVRNIRRSMVEYHDILWDIGYAKTFEDAFERIDNLYAERPPLNDFLDWRDERVLDEIYWYGWFIDYWMEAGLMRCMFTHKITTPEHWYMLMQPTRYTKEEMAYDLIVGNDTVVTPSYDPHCVNDVSGGCHPIQIISAERLVETTTGPEEGVKIARSLRNNTGVEDYLIAEEAWNCIWTELIVNKKGLKTFIDREGITERDYNFSEQMLEGMVIELTRLIDKYSSPTWNWRQTAQDVVELLEEHRELVQEELDDVRSGKRKLNKFDMLGSKTRERMLSTQSGPEDINHRNLQAETNSFNFRELEEKIFQERQKRIYGGQKYLRRN